ncbi:6410_t:CDS:2 [Acaulospora colombiana]|uniref:6410_t:CDS:1 n=1 Tax=Acaulospora colombiana TaxID=27376 RepID=A0ACA9N5T6_9GLOM|nr:6410_t:CDS:2 [Acaulospora colombiana]
MSNGNEANLLRDLTDLDGPSSEPNEGNIEHFFRLGGVYVADAENVRAAKENPSPVKYLDATFCLWGDGKPPKRGMPDWWPCAGSPGSMTRRSRHSTAAGRSTSISRQGETMGVSGQLEFWKMPLTMLQLSNSAASKHDDIAKSTSSLRSSKCKPWLRDMAKTKPQTAVSRLNRGFIQ